MYSFLISCVVLLLGSFFYSRFIEKVFGADSERLTPAYSNTANADFVPMRTSKVFMIQFLNIAGTGPIFGPILGAMYGPSCYLWIVLGCLFGGSVHDYLSGMISLRHNGAGLPAIVGLYLGKTTSRVMRAFTLLMLVLVGVVFVYSPAILIQNLFGGSKTVFFIALAAIMLYYLVATIAPIDKIIGKIYPFFAAALLFMAVAMFIGLLVHWPSMPEIWGGLKNMSPENGSIFPCMFISIACGAVSGFHATQSPLMARCLKNEKYGRPVFFGSMVSEGLVALIWAAVASYFFYGGGASEMNAEGITDAPNIVYIVSKHWLGVAGAVFTLIGVVVAPISTGDTALRSARLIIAESFNLKQDTVMQRLKLSLPIFIVTSVLLIINMNSSAFGRIWQYFGWSNQMLSVFTFWALTVFLANLRPGKPYYFITLIPAAFMTGICISFLLTQKITFHLPLNPAATVAVVFALSIICFYAIRFLYRSGKALAGTMEGEELLDEQKRRER